MFICVLYMYKYVQVQILQQVLIRMEILATCVDVLHCLVIISTCNRIISNQLLNIYTLYIDVSLTLIRAIIHRTTYTSHTKIQIIFSAAMTNAFARHRWYFVAWLYLLKIEQLHRILKRVRKFGIFNWDGLCKYYGFVFDVLRFTLILRLFFKAVMMIYIYMSQSTQSFPQAYAIMYQLLATAFTFGFGDKTRNSDYQIMVFAYCTPFLCSAFILYVLNIAKSYSKVFIESTKQNKQFNIEQQKQTSNQYLEQE